MSLAAKSFEEVFNFTRSSVATYIGPGGYIKEAAADEPRFTRNPITFAQQGALVEGSSTNRLTYSEDISAWVIDALTVSAGTELSPNGVDVAGSFFETATNAQHRFKRNPLNCLAGKQLCQSVFIKRVGVGNTRNINLTMFDGVSATTRATAVFDLDLVEVASTSGNLFLNASVEPYRDGWFKLSISLNNTTGAELTSITPIFTFADSGATTYLGDPTIGFAAWGVQVEDRPSASSYIKTEAATVTRSSDVLDIGLLSWLASGKGTLVIKIKIDAGFAPGAVRKVFQFDDGSNNNGLFVSFIETPTPLFVLKNGGVNETLIGSNAGSATEFDTLAFSYVDDELKGCINGGAVAVKTPVTNAIPTISEVHIGKDHVLSFLTGVISSFTYYPRVLSDEEMVVVTVA